jgi:recombinational DNA repair protein RecR
MNKEDIIRMAQEAGLHIATDVNWMPIIGLEYAEKFAALVASAEREACAKVCEAMEEKAEGTECCKWPTPIDCAHAIRARGQA